MQTKEFQNIFENVDSFHPTDKVSQYKHKYFSNTMNQNMETEFFFHDSSSTTNLKQNLLEFCPLEVFDSYKVKQSVHRAEHFNGFVFHRLQRDYFSSYIRKFGNIVCSLELQNLQRCFLEQSSTPTPKNHSHFCEYLSDKFGKCITQRFYYNVLFATTENLSCYVPFRLYLQCQALSQTSTKDDSSSVPLLYPKGCNYLYRKYSTCIMQELSVITNLFALLL